MDLSNVFVQIFLFFLVFSMVTKIVLDGINLFYRRARLGVIPEILKDNIDKDQLVKIDNYSNDTMIYETVTRFVSTLFLLLLLLTGFYPWLLKTLSVYTLNPYILCFLFFAAGSVVDTLISIPFSLYFDFVIENKYGFNTMTLKLWIADFIKGILLSIILGVIVLIPVIFTLTTFKKMWWLIIWVIMIGFSLLIQIVYPVFIAPLFNKFKPISDDTLKNAVETVLTKSKYKSDGVFEMDASKRSGHSNAYFTGIGKTKKIVLFDTLIASATPEEIAAVLAHEIGHYKKKHIIKGMILSSVLSLFGLYCAYLFTGSDYIYKGFGFTDVIPSQSLYIGLFLISIVSGPVLFFTKPLFAALSRKNEFEADEYSKEITGNPEALRSALIKLNVKNLSNLYPAPAYVNFYYSHPPLLERIEKLKN